MSTQIFLLSQAMQTAVFFASSAIMHRFLYACSRVDDFDGLTVQEAVFKWSRKNDIKLSTELVSGLRYPLETKALRRLFDEDIFPRFEPLVKLGRNKFARQTSFENSATTDDALLDDAAFFESTFLDLLGEIVYSTGRNCSINAGPENKFLFKSLSRINDKKERAVRVRDVLRASIVASDINTLVAAIKNAIDICKSKGVDTMSNNFYENAALYGDSDRKEGRYNGYFSYHLVIALRCYRVQVCNQEDDELNDEVQTTISIDRGTNVYRDFLSSADGGKVQLFSKKVAIQKWTLLRVISRGGEDCCYNIRITVASGSVHYLGCMSDSSAVALVSEDDGSGSQHWCFQEIRPGVYNILNKGPHRIATSVIDFPDKKQFAFLSCTADGAVDLYSHDDGSGRQQWNLDSFEKPLKLAKTIAIPTTLLAEIQFHPEQIFNSNSRCIRGCTHDAYERLTSTLGKEKEVEKAEQVEIEKGKLMKAIELHFAFGLSQVK